jgi:hypothetical protein
MTALAFCLSGLVSPFWGPLVHLGDSQHPKELQPSRFLQPSLSFAQKAVAIVVSQTWD